MGALKIVVRKKALRFIEDTALWYELKMGRSAAMHFVDGIWNTLLTLSNMPSIGMIDKRRSTEHAKYYSFLAHPKYRIIYRFTDKQLYIVAIQATEKKS